MTHDDEPPSTAHAAKSDPPAFLPSALPDPLTNCILRRMKLDVVKRAGITWNVFPNAASVSYSEGGLGLAR